MEKLSSFVEQNFAQTIVDSKYIRRLTYIRNWDNVPKYHQKANIKEQTRASLDPTVTEGINKQIQQSLSNGSAIIHKTDRLTHILDPQKNGLYVFTEKELRRALTRITPTIKSSFYPGITNARLTLSNYLAFFNIETSDTNFALRFYPQDNDSIPLIYSIKQEAPQAKLILGINPYIKNTILVGTEA